MICKERSGGLSFFKSLGSTTPFLPLKSTCADEIDIKAEKIKTRETTKRIDPNTILRMVFSPLTEIMRQTWPPQSRTGFGDLSHRG